VRPPPALASLFWDHPLEAIDTDRHADLVMERILEYGSLAAARWALATYGVDGLRAFLRRRGVRVLSRKTLSFWIFLLDLEGDECFAPSSLNRSRPFWNY
jgi:hypothetical protein